MARRQGKAGPLCSLPALAQPLLSRPTAPVYPTGQWDIETVQGLAWKPSGNGRRAEPKPEDTERVCFNTSLCFPPPRPEMCCCLGSLLPHLWAQNWDGPGSGCQSQASGGLAMAKRRIQQSVGPPHSPCSICSFCSQQGPLHQASLRILNPILLESSQHTTFSLKAS